MSHDIKMLIIIIFIALHIYHVIGSDAYFDADTFEKEVLQDKLYKFQCTYCRKRIQGKVMFVPKIREKFMLELLNNATQGNLANWPSFLLDIPLASQEKDAESFEENVNIRKLGVIHKLKFGVTIA